MDIFELEEEQRELEAKITSKKERIELECSKLGIKAIDYTKPSVQSSPRKDPMLDVFAVISEMEQDMERLQKQLSQNKKELDRLYEIYKQYKNRDKQIFIEKKLYKWSNTQISLKHNNITDRQIQRIVKKMSKYRNKC